METIFKDNFFLIQLGYKDVDFPSLLCVDTENMGNIILVFLASNEHPLDILDNPFFISIDEKRHIIKFRNPQSKILV